LVVVVSAGNEGGRAWKRVTFPGDVTAAITVGACSADGKRRRHSSGSGAVSEQTVKPDFVTDSVGQGSSISTPAVTGLVACLREKFPEATRLELFEALKASASNLASPNADIGYGVPNGTKAFKALGSAP
jgi:subtilisin family serine protease